MQTDMTRRKFVGLAAMGAAFLAAPAQADAPATFTVDEVVDDGHRFFGSVSRGLAEGIQEACRRWGLPNAYVLGQEASGAFIGGLRYGEGKMYTRNAGNQPVYWQGPSVGFDYGADGDRTMMLVYNLPAVECDFPPIRRNRRIRILHRRDRVHGAECPEHCGGSNPNGSRGAPRSQRELSEIHPAGDLEPVLTTHIDAKRGRAEQASARSLDTALTIAPRNSWKRLKASIPTRALI